MFGYSQAHGFSQPSRLQLVDPRSSPLSAIAMAHPHATGPAVDNDAHLSTEDVNEAFIPPQPGPHFSSFLPSIQDTSARNSYINSTPATPDVSRPFLSEGAIQDPFLDKPEDGPTGAINKPARRRWPLFVVGGAIAAVVIVLAVVLPVTLVHKHHGGGGSSSGTSDGGAHDPTATANPESPTGALTGGNGTVIQADDGSTFTYINNFGGFCMHCISYLRDCTDPVVRGGRPSEPVQQQR